jgi:AbrB family looped-hinge helix DNA binding protein
MNQEFLLMPITKLSVVQERGQITIPKQLREKKGLRKGVLVQFEETDRGILITPQETAPLDAMKKLGAILKENGLTLEDLMKSGRKVRGRIVKEKYGLDSDE